MVKTKLKITTVVSYTYPYIGSGIGNVALKQSEILAERGHNVFILSANNPIGKSEFIYNKVNHIKYPALLFLEKLHIPVPLTLFSLKTIKRLIESDIVHVHDILYPSSFIASILAKINRKPLIITYHIGHVKYKNVFIDLIEKITRAFIGNIILILADRIIVINSSARHELMKFKDKLVYIPNGVDTSLFHSTNKLGKLKLKKKHKIPINKKVVLFVGRLVPKKGYRLILEAISTKYLIVMIGSGKLEERTNKSYLSWIGPKTPKIISEFYRLSDVFVLPSEGEGFPLCLTEALSSGLPVITTFEDEVFKNFPKEYYTQVSQNSHQIIQEINKQLKRKRFTNKKLLSKLVKKNFNWHNNVKNTEKIYMELIK